VLLAGAAVDSVWVRREIESYTRQRKDLNVAPVVLEGDPREVIPPEVAAIDSRYHDLRNGWILGILRPRAKEELLRLLALVTNVDLRTLRNWHLRRTLAKLAAGVAMAVLLGAAVLSLPLDDWQPLDIKADRGAPLYAIACGNRDAQLWAGWRLRRPGPQGFRNYIAVTDTAKPSEQFSIPEKFHVSERLLPVDQLTFDVREGARKVFSQNLLSRLVDPSALKDPAFPSLWLDEPSKGRFVAVARHPPTREAVDAERQEEADFAEQNVHRMPLGTALVATFDGKTTHVAPIKGLDPEWPARNLLSGPDAAAEPASPANGLPIVWLDDGTLWLGMPARRDREKGGLWRSDDQGASWKRVEGFSGVNSISRAGGDAHAVIVTELHHDRWTENGFLEPSPTRVLVSRGDPNRWVTAGAPPFGSRSEVEVCGQSSDGKTQVRVDERIFQQRTIRLGQWLRDHISMPSSMH
jgi:hypothetical protein